MGFLLTSYNSLPEQVEANKKKCKDLQEQIDNIDTHEIEEVKAQVQTNTQNIGNVTQGLGVTNTALNAVTLDVNDLKPRVTNLETKTSNMSKSGVDTSFTESINVAKAINVGTDVNAEGVITGSVLVTTDDYGEGRLYIDEDTNVTIAQALNSGIVITENNIEEYAPQTHLYQHNLLLRQSGGNNVQFMFHPIYKTNNNAIDLAELATYLYNNNSRDREGAYFTNKPYYIYPFLMYSSNGTAITLEVYTSTSSPAIQTVTIVSDTITQIS